MNKKIVSYEDSIKEIESIVHEIEHEDIKIDTLTHKVKRAIELIDFCKKKLSATEQELETLFSEELPKDN